MQYIEDHDKWRLIDKGAYTPEDDNICAHHRGAVTAARAWRLRARPTHLSKLKRINVQHMHLTGASRRFSDSRTIYCSGKNGSIGGARMLPGFDLSTCSLAAR